MTWSACLGKWVRAVALAALMAFGAALPAAPVAAEQPTPVPSQTTLDARKVTLPPRSASSSPKLDSHLSEMATAAQQHGASAAAEQARASALQTQDTRVRIVVEATDAAAAKAAIEALGGQVEQTYHRLVQALMPPAALTQLAGNAAVQRVRPPFQPVTQSGLIDEAVHLSGADVWQAAGTNGAGVRVAIIDQGFSGIATLQSSGDLPSGTLTPQDFCEGNANVGNHGTAVASNVYHMAPGAQLTLICVGTDVDLGAAESAAKAQGIQIVVHALNWFNTSRGDGSGADGTPDAILGDARANGILWVNAAGNYATQHWSGTYVDSDGHGFLTFAPGDDGNYIFIFAGQQACVFLKWDQWPTSSHDYDLYLIDPSTMMPVRQIAHTHATAPTDQLCYTNPPTSTQNQFFVAVKDASGPATDTPRLDLFVTGNTDFHYKVAAGSLPEPASSQEVLAVGAVCWQNNSLEPFSAQGPTIDGRNKPDMVGQDATSNAVFGPATGCTHGFLGTSAAAAHVGGAAALIKQANPSATPAQLQKLLTDNAHGLGSANQYGAGVLTMPALSAPLPGDTSLIHSLDAPVRLADTRSNNGPPIASGSFRCFTVTALGIPSDAAAVVLNVTAAAYPSLGWLTVFPAGQPVPQTSTVNFDTTEYAMANGTIARIGTSGQVCVQVGTPNGIAGSAHVILDATGYVTSNGATEMPMLGSPQRLVDTRAQGGAIASGQSRCFTMPSQQAGIPSDATAVILNVTAVGYLTQGWLTVYPNGQMVPPTSTVNFDPSEYAIANGAIMRLGDNGQVCVSVGTPNNVPGSAQVILDATGYLTATGLAQVAMLPAPVRLADTRANGAGPVVANGAPRCFQVAHLDGIPATATGVLVNVTAVGYHTPGWLTVFPNGQLLPATSTVNFDTSEYAIANGAIMRVGTNQQVCVSVGTPNGVAGVAHVIIDAVGYLTQ